MESRGRKLAGSASFCLDSLICYNELKEGWSESMRENIMVIDDDEKITSMLRRGLAFEGYSVVTATNGADGLKQMLTANHIC